jgi:hypothetical protein
MIATQLRLSKRGPPKKYDPNMETPKLKYHGQNAMTRMTKTIDLPTERVSHILQYYANATRMACAIQGSKL